MLEKRKVKNGAGNRTFSIDVQKQFIQHSKAHGLLYTIRAGDLWYTVLNDREITCIEAEILVREFNELYPAIQGHYDLQ